MHIYVLLLAMRFVINESVIGCSRLVGMAAFNDGVGALLGEGDLLDQFGEVGDVMAFVQSPDSTASIALNSLDSWLSSPGNEEALEELLLPPTSNVIFPLEGGGSDDFRSSESLSSHSSDSGNHSPSSYGGGLHSYDAHITPGAGGLGNWQPAQFKISENQHGYPTPVMAPYEAGLSTQGALYHPQHDSYFSRTTAAPIASMHSTQLPPPRAIRPAPRRSSEAPQTPQRPMPFAANCRVQLDHHLQKREDRRIRNRAAAQTSREKKKVEQEQLRGECTVLAAKCRGLELENERLSGRLDTAEKENLRLIAEACSECRRKFATAAANSISYDGGSTSGRRRMNMKRAGLCLLALVGTFTLNWPIETSSLFSRQPKEIVLLQGKMAAGETFNATKTGQEELPLLYNRPNGRSLAYANESTVVHRRNASETFRLFLQDPPPNAGVKGVNASNGVRCPSGSEWKLQMNATESLRLNNDLWSWMDRHEVQKMNELRRAGYLLYPSRSMLASHGYYDAGDIGEVFSASYYPNDGDHASGGADRVPKWPLGGGGSRRRTTWEKKESARLKADRDRAWRHLLTLVVRDRAWRHLGMISPSQQGPDLTAKQETNDSMGAVDTRPQNESVPAEKLVQLITSIQQAVAKNPASEESMLYLVALHDYFLLPSLTPRFNASQLTNAEHWQNSSMAYGSSGGVLPPPRLTLILPALSTINGSGRARGNGEGGQKGHPSLMRIQCEVVGTGLIHLPDGNTNVVVPTLFDSRHIRQ